MDKIKNEPQINEKNPKFRKNVKCNQNKDFAILRIQSIARMRIAMKETQRLFHTTIERVFDPKYDCYFYYNKKTGLSSWNKPKFLCKDENFEFAVIKIQRSVRKKICTKSEKIISNECNLKKNDSSQGEHNKDKYSSYRNDLSSLEKDIEKWTTQNVAHWFNLVGLGQYSAKIIEYDVDGPLLMRLEEEELKEIGITSKIHQRKFEMKIKKQMNIEIGFLSKYKSDVESTEEIKASTLNNKSTGNDDGDIKKDDNQFEKNQPSNMAYSAEEAETFSKEILFHGEDGLRPQVGDTLQIHYTIAVNEKMNVIENSRERRNEPFQFIVGNGDVVKGLDDALLHFNRGERSLIKIMPEFAYGVQGLPSLIPENATMFCDVELIGISHELIKTKVWLQNVPEIEMT